MKGRQIAISRYVDISVAAATRLCLSDERHTVRPREGGQASGQRQGAIAISMTIVLSLSLSYIYIYIYNALAYLYAYMQTWTILDLNTCRRRDTDAKLHGCNLQRYVDGFRRKDAEVHRHSDTDAQTHRYTAASTYRHTHTHRQSYTYMDA